MSTSLDVSSQLRSIKRCNSSNDTGVYSRLTLMSPLKCCSPGNLRCHGLKKSPHTQPNGGFAARRSSPIVWPAELWYIARTRRALKLSKAYKYQLKLPTWTLAPGLSFRSWSRIRLASSTYLVARSVCDRPTLDGKLLIAFFSALDVIFHTLNLLELKKLKMSAAKSQKFCLLVETLRWWILTVFHCCCKF